MKRRRRWVWLVRGVAGAGVLIYLVSQCRSGELAAALRSVSAGWWAVAVGAYLLGQLLCAWKWGVLARALGMPRPYRALVAYYFGGMFFNLFLPTTVGGDVGRAAALARPDGTIARALVSVLADRGSGFVALLLWASAAVIALRAVPPWIAGATLAGAVLALAGTIAALSAPDRFRRLGEAVHGALTACRAPATLASVGAMSLVFHGVVAVAHALVGRALGLELAFGYYLLAATLGAVVAMAPVTVNGLGTREAAYVFFLGMGGVPRETALAFAFGWLALILFSGGVGGAVFVLLAPGRGDLFRPGAPAAYHEGDGGDG